MRAAAGEVAEVVSNDQAVTAAGRPSESEIEGVVRRATDVVREDVGARDREGRSVPLKRAEVVAVVQGDSSDLRPAGGCHWICPQLDPSVKLGAHGDVRRGVPGARRSKVPVCDLAACGPIDEEALAPGVLPREVERS